jgi:hypothetical protein
MVLRRCETNLKQEWIYLNGRGDVERKCDVGLKLRYMKKSMCHDAL